jgi:hypothetical protein
MRFLSAADVETRLARGDRLMMELRSGSRLWWFENPYAVVSDRVIATVAMSATPKVRLFEAGDSLFGLPLNSQTWLPCAGATQ